MINNHKDIACKRLRGIGLTKQQALLILDTVNNWFAKNGSDWTINRLKTLKVAYINKLAGNALFASDSWIAHSVSGPKGAFKCIFNLKKPQKALSALMVYTDVVSNDITPKQWNKFISGVETQPIKDEQEFCSTLGKSLRLIVDIPECDGESLEGGDTFSSIKRRHKLKVNPKAKFDNVEQWYSKDTRVPVIVSELRPDSTDFEIVDKVRTSDNSVESFVNSLQIPLVQEFLENLDETGDDNIMMVKALAFSNGENDTIDPLIVGRIGFIQEPGNKLRTVANPFGGVQWIMSKLGNQLYPLLRELKEDYTFKQDAIVDDVQQFWAHNPGTTLMSIDLSSATDLFPLDLQLALLAKLGVEKTTLSFFERVSRGKWILPEKVQMKYSKEYVSWTQGQPLGLYPSFAAFALTHHALARTCNPKFYGILGDDIVIDQQAGQQLIKLYEKIGCKISWDKTITSSLLCEFGGKLISEKASYIQPKWRSVSDHNFIELAKKLGPKSISLFRPRQQRILKLLDPIPKDLSPYGLGWNTKGLPYNDRVAYFESLNLLMKEKLVDYVTKSNLQLRDLKSSIELGQFLEFPFLMERTDDSHDISSFETLVLITCSISRVALPEDPFIESKKDLVPDPTIRLSDPRGETTLTKLEKVLAPSFGR